MSLGKGAKLGIGGVALSVVATMGFGFAPPPPEQLPTVKVWHNPT